jgi:hypothetical protein
MVSAQVFMDTKNKAMKSIRKMEHLLDAHRSNIILLLLVLCMGLYAFSCDPKAREVPASEVYSDASAAREIPDWAPAETSSEVRYYFIPEIDVYYDAFVGEYVYWNGSLWVYSARLPRAYARYDLYDANIVLLSAGVASPWMRHDYYVATYPVTYFYEPHYVHYGHGWRVYDENRRQFYVSHKNKVHNNIHIHNHNKSGHGWGGDRFPRGGKGWGSEPEGSKGWYDRGKGGHDGWDGNPGGRMGRDPQNPQPGKPAVKYDRDYRGKGDLKSPSPKDVMKQPDGRYEQRRMGDPGGYKQTGSPTRKMVSPPSPKQQAPQPTRVPGAPKQGQSGSHPKGGQGGK